MAEHEFPPNSDASKKPRNEEKKVERVTTGEVTRKKKSIRKQFGQMFVAGDFKSSINYVILEVALPLAQDMVIETFQQGIEKLFRGEIRRRGSTPPQAGQGGYVSYNRVGPMSSIISQPQRAMSRQARAKHDFDSIILENRAEAEEVIERLFDIVGRYEQATVADLYELVGIASTHTDHKWGWTDLRGARVSRMRGNYYLDLPDPHPLG